MQLTPGQIQVLKSKKRFRVLCAGRRFGKTVLSVEEMVGCAVAENDRYIAYVAPTYRQARDIAWEMLKKRVKPIAAKINESRLEIEVNTQKGGTSKISLRGWESIEGLRGQKFHFMVLDEVAMMRNFWIGWQEVLRPALTDTMGSVLFISTPKGYNHFYDLFSEEDENYESFRFTTYDNPFIPVEEIDAAKAELPEDRFYQEYMADFRKMEGLVYKEFDRMHHVTNEMPRTYVRRIVGIDWGYTNPYAFLLIGIDRDNHYWIITERYETQKTTEDIIQVMQTIKKDDDFNDVYPDPAEPDRIAQLRKAGFNCKEVSKDKVKGIDTVRSLLKDGRIHVHSSCKNLIAEFETYHYPDKKPNKNESEEPVKEGDHALDALRYALYNLPKPKKEKRGYTPNFKSHQSKLRYGR